MAFIKLLIKGQHYSNCQRHGHFIPNYTALLKLITLWYFDPHFQSDRVEFVLSQAPMDNQTSQWTWSRVVSLTQCCLFKKKTKKPPTLFKRISRKNKLHTIAGLINLSKIPWCILIFYNDFTPKANTREGITPYVFLCYYYYYCWRFVNLISKIRLRVEA